MGVAAHTHTLVCESHSWNWRFIWNDLLCHQNGVTSWEPRTQNSRACGDISELPVTFGPWAFLKEKLRAYSLPEPSRQEEKTAMVKCALG